MAKHRFFKVGIHYTYYKSEILGRESVSVKIGGHNLIYLGVTLLFGLQPPPATPT
jgi:hypothetical protein